MSAAKRFLPLERPAPIIAPLVKVGSAVRREIGPARSRKAAKKRAGTARRGRL